MTTLRTVMLSDEEIAILATAVAVMSRSEVLDVMTPSDAATVTWNSVFSSKQKVMPQLGTLATMLAEL